MDPQPAVESEDQDAIRFAEIVNQNRGVRQETPFEPADPSLLTADQARAWTADGFFVVRGAIDSARCDAINEAAIARVRAAEQRGAEMKGTRFDDGRIVIAEQNFESKVPSAEDRASKVYNLHRERPFRDFAIGPEVSELLGGVAGPEAGVFQSQFIFKNPGAWGQPWHQDSLYFRFDRHPQVGIWLATSPATPENGCLYVSPGSHREPLHEHRPDSRPGANYGYVEVRDHDFSNERALPMETGDLLVFHSFLMHRSADNRSDARRTAYVLHCGEWGTRWNGLVSPTIDWVRARRRGAPVDLEGVPARVPWSIRAKLKVGAFLARVRKPR